MWGLGDKSLIKVLRPETAVPYTRMREAGYEIRFVTENGQTPECDKRMLEGITQKLLV
jgi:putative intracellular protease/amidase